jgi:hypothetical protein
VINTDHGAGAPRGWLTQGREDLASALGALAPMLTGLGGDAIGTKMTCGSDHCPFVLAGVPALELDVDDSKYDEVHHLPSDTIDKVNASQLARDAAVVAVTTWVAADWPARFAPRVAHDAIAESLKKANLDAALAGAGLWKP